MKWIKYGDIVLHFHSPVQKIAWYYKEQKWWKATGFSEFKYDPSDETIHFGLSDTDHLNIVIIDESSMSGQLEVNNAIIAMQYLREPKSPEIKDIPLVPEVKVTELSQQVINEEQAKEIYDKKRWEIVKKWASRIKDILPALTALISLRKAFKK